MIGERDNLTETATALSKALFLHCLRKATLRSAAIRVIVEEPSETDQQAVIDRANTILQEEIAKAEAIGRANFERLFEDQYKIKILWKDCEQVNLEDFIQSIKNAHSMDNSYLTDKTVEGDLTRAHVE